MSLLLNTGAMHYRENANEEWKPLVIKADVDIESLADPYSPLSTYSVGEYCTHDGKVYRCISTISTAEAWNSSHWQETTIGQELESINYVRPNLLDNWYFVGGGSQLGYGTFPINQRGQTSYGNSNTYTVDRWKLTDGSLAVVSGGITLNGTIEQILSSSIGFPVFASALLSDGTMITPSYNDSTKTFTLTATGQTIIAVKLEIGNTQTLAHQENGVWVLNEMPDYAIEFAKCEAYLWVLDFPFNYAKCAAGGITGTTTDSCRIILRPPVQMRYATTLASMVGGPVYVLCEHSKKQIASFSWANCTGSTITLAPILNTAFSSNEAVLYLENETSTAKIIISVE